MDSWETDDLAMASYIAMHLDVSEVNWIDGTCYWSFEDGPELEDLVVEYTMGEPLVNARKFHQKLADLKRSIFDAQRRAQSA